MLRSRFSFAVLAGAVALLLAVTMWMRRDPHAPGGPSSAPARPSTPSGTVQGQGGRAPRGADVKIPDPLRPADSQAAPREALGAWLASISGHPDLLSAYRDAPAGDLDAGVLLQPVVHCIAAFPDIALEHYSRILGDPKAPYERKALALDHLSVLARKADPEIRRLYLETMKSAEARLKERAAAWAGRYFWGEELRNALLECALAGSDAARLALSHERGTDPVTLGLKGAGEEGVAAIVRARLELLSGPDYRLRLADVLKGDRTFPGDRPRETLLWAISCASRLECAELAEHIRKAAVQLGVPTTAGPDQWTYWEMQHDQGPVASAVRALDRLGAASDLEKRFLAEYGWDGTRESARRAITARREQRYYRDMFAWTKD